MDWITQWIMLGWGHISEKVIIIVSDEIDACHHFEDCSNLGKSDFVFFFCNKLKQIFVYVCYHVYFPFRERIYARESSTYADNS